jgi:Fe-S-cluster containining protein
METLPCDGCAAPCCREYTIYLDGGDAYRIARTLKVPISDFVDLEPAREPPEHRDERWAIRLDGSSLRYRMHLRRVADSFPGHSRRCLFLVTVGERGRCGIYSSRPSACAAYPTSFAGGLIGLGGGGQYCPPDAWQLESLDVPAFRLWHRRQRQGAVVYRALVDAWNARVERPPSPPHPRLFYDFLFNAYDQLRASAPALLEDAPLDAPLADAIAGDVARAVSAMGW